LSNASSEFQLPLRPLLMYDGLAQLKLPLLFPSIVFLELGLNLLPQDGSHFLLPNSFALHEDLVIELLSNNRDE